MYSDGEDNDVDISDILQALQLNPREGGARTKEHLGDQSFPVQEVGRRDARMRSSLVWSLTVGPADVRQVRVSTVTQVAQLTQSSPAQPSANSQPSSSVLLPHYLSDRSRHLDATL